jgi:hypothetical protein
MSETPQPTVQDATGTLVDQSLIGATPTTKPTETPTPSPAASTDPSPKASTEPAKPADPSLLNKDAPKPAEGAPEAYVAFKVPDGYELDAKVLEEASPIFKELGLPQAAAQRLVDLWSKHSAATSDGLAEAVRKQNETWQGEARAHPDLKGKLDPGGPVLTTISRALDSLGNAKLTADFKAAMDFTGAGNHPAFIRTFYALAAKLAEGTHVAGNGPSPLGQAAPGARPASPAKALYPNLP